MSESGIIIYQLQDITMSLEETIMNNMKAYFKENSFAKWKDIYKKKQGNIAHDEPWLTLVSFR